jgi:hypothetical protein
MMRMHVQSICGDPIGVQHPAQLTDVRNLILKPKVRQISFQILLQRPFYNALDSQLSFQ